MTNSEDVFRQKLAAWMDKNIVALVGGGASACDAVAAEAVRLHADAIQAKDQRIAELEADVEQRRQSLEHANATILRQREKLAALEAEYGKHDESDLANCRCVECRLGAALLNLSSSRAEVERLTKERSLHEEVLEDKLRDAMARLTEALDRCERAEKALAAAQIAISAIKTCGFDDWGTADALKQFEDLSGASLSPGQPEERLVYHACVSCQEEFLSSKAEPPTHCTSCGGRRFNSLPHCPSCAAKGWIHYSSDKCLLPPTTAAGQPEGEKA